MNTWKSFEVTYGTENEVKSLEAQMPKRVKKRRKLDDGTFEEYMDYLFPADEQQNQKLSKLLEMAHKWKQSQVPGGSSAA